MISKRAGKKSKTVRYQDTQFYFDDCPICQAMKEAENEGRGLNASELKQAFKEAEKQGAVVGGEMFEERE